MKGISAHSAVLASLALGLFSGGCAAPATRTGPQPEPLRPLFQLTRVIDYLKSQGTRSLEGGFSVYSKSLGNVSVAYGESRDGRTFVKVSVDELKEGDFGYARMRMSLMDEDCDMRVEPGERDFHFEGNFNKGYRQRAVEFAAQANQFAAYLAENRDEVYRNALESFQLRLEGY